MDWRTGIEEVITKKGDKIEIKKSFDTWKVVYPVKNKDGTWNWFNLLTGGSWIKLLIMIVIVFIVIGCVYEYSIAVEKANDCITKLNVFNYLK
jgi:hypothetical protein